MQMSGPGPSTSWTSKVWSALFLVLVVAVVARAIWVLLAPMLPLLIVAAALVWIIGFILHARRH